MVNLNLFPWREAERRSRTRFLICAMIMGAVVFLACFCLRDQVHEEETRIKPAPVVPAPEKPMTAKARMTPRQPNRDFSLTQMHIVGFMQRGDECEALVLLPDQRTLAVKKGALLGKERGRITAVAARRITLRLPDKKIVLLR